MRKLVVALTLALVLLVPGTPAPTRAGFEFEVPAPLIVYIEGTLDADGQPRSVSPLV
jgi:hypothetical protein